MTRRDLLAALGWLLTPVIVIMVWLGLDAARAALAQMMTVIK